METTEVAIRAAKIVVFFLSMKNKRPRNFVVREADLIGQVTPQKLIFGKYRCLSLLGARY